MRRYLPFILFILTSLLPVSADGQELIHKYSEPFCEYGMGTVDILLSELQQDMTANGVIVLHGTSEDPLFPYMERKTILNHLRFRRFDERRIVFSLGAPEPKTSTELWKVPTDRVAKFEGKPWDLSLSDLQKPVLVYSEEWTVAIGCEFVFSHEFYAQFLDKNPDLVGRIIIQDRSKGKYQKARARIEKEMIKKSKIHPGRLEFVFRPNEVSNVEYWYFMANRFEIDGQDNPADRMPSSIEH